MPRFCAVVAITALALLSTAINAHMIMATPTPFNNETIDNSPLSSSGSNFPCKLTGDPATFYNAAGITNNMAVGQQQTLSFRGSAVHGGGSCQLAITSDKQPSTTTTWQVILSIEGGCPSTDGNGPSTYSFKIPAGVTPGNYVLAWTWVSKLAGQPEYYMNCAPITVTGGSSKKRSEESSLFQRDSLPNLFVANLQSINSCKTTPGTDPVYPNPGSNVLKPGTSPEFADPNSYGQNCFALGGSSNSGSGSAPNGSAAAAPSSSAAAAPSGSAETAPTASSPAGAAPSDSSSGGSSAISGSVTALSVPTSSVASSGLSSSTTTTANSFGPATPSSTSSSGSTPAGLTGACTSEGIWNCIGGTTWQRCASGLWSVMQPMPGGTSCKPGQSQDLWARSRRISRSNMFKIAAV